MSTANLQIENKKALIPQLRFQEFEENWEEKTLFDISKDISYGMNAAAKAFDGTHKYIRITDIDSESRRFIPNPLTSPEGDIDEKFKLKVNDLLFTRTGASVGKSYLYDSKDGALYYAGFLIKFNIAKADSYFVYSLTLKESYDKWVQVNSMRSGQPGLNAEEYKGLKLNIPTLPEQQKIASFLSTIDEKIQQLSRKKELLEQYKKGVMQQLFSGKLRFKDENGKEYPDWEEKKLGDILKRTSTGLNPRTNFILGSGKNYYVTIKNISNGTLDFKSCEKIDDEALKLIKKRSDLSKDDIIMSSIGNIGEAYLLDKDPINWNINESVFMLRASEYVIPKYLYYIITNDISKWYFESNSTGSSFKSIKLAALKLLPINLPSLLEQQKIATFLSNIDKKIESTNQQINQTQSFKKGLLQQLFC